MKIALRVVYLLFNFPSWYYTNFLAFKFVMIVLTTDVYIILPFDFYNFPNIYNKQQN